MLRFNDDEDVLKIQTEQSRSRPLPQSFLQPFLRRSLAIIFVLGCLLFLTASFFSVNSSANVEDDYRIHHTHRKNKKNRAPEIGKRKTGKSQAHSKAARLKPNGSSVGKQFQSFPYLDSHLSSMWDLHRDFDNSENGRRAREREESSRSPGKSKKLHVQTFTAEQVAGQRCSDTGNSLYCMACNIYFEGRGESYTGMVEIGRTVMTRLQDHQYGQSICGIIYSPYQFSWTIRGSHRLPKSGENLDAMKEAIKAAKAAMRIGPNGATHYHADYVNPGWSHSQKCSLAPVAGDGYGKTDLQDAEVGKHIFYTCTAEIDYESASIADSSGQTTPWPAATSGGFVDMTPNDQPSTQNTDQNPGPNSNQNSGPPRDRRPDSSRAGAQAVR